MVKQLVQIRAIITVPKWALSNITCQQKTTTTHHLVGRVAQSVQRLTAGWMIRDRIPVGTRFSARPDRPWGPPRLLYNGYRVFPGGKVRPGRAADHSAPSSAAVMEEQCYTSTHPLGHTGPVTGSLYFYSPSHAAEHPQFALHLKLSGAPQLR